jgi:hypothetical protein
MNTKICISCNVQKELSCFGKSSREKDGHKNKCLDCYKEWRSKNRNKILAYKNKYYEKNHGDILARERQRYILNKEKEASRKREYNARQEVKDRRNEKRKKLLKTDPKYKLELNISSAIRDDLKNRGSSKSFKKWEDCLAYNIDQLKEHLEKQFNSSMNWSNHGVYWHIDHIRPKSWFKYESTDDEAFIKCWSLDNLQPLEAQINITKGNRYEG